MSADRYQVSKLLEILLVREMATTLDRLDGQDSHDDPTTQGAEASPGEEGRRRVLVNAVNPGLCRSALFDNLDIFARLMFRVVLFLVGRSVEAGARTLVAGAVAGEEAHGKYMDSCLVSDPSRFVTSEEGERVGKKVWEELLAILERSDGPALRRALGG
jgi:retinol dehydrogenase-12